MHPSALVAVVVALLTVGAMLARPWGLGEWLWAVAGALAELLLGAIAPAAAWSAVLGGGDVYAFLIGVLLMAEAARCGGVFDWLAGHAGEWAGGSRWRVLALLYGVGVLVTATLSNDMAIIVLTPAALALARRLGGSPMPLLFACAFVANAASFLLPAGNPANLLIYGSGLPPLGAWLATYGPAAAAAIVLTFLGLAFASRRELAAPVAAAGERPRSTPRSRLGFGLLAASAAVLAGASALGLPLGATALLCACATLALLSVADRGIAVPVVRATTWSVVPLLAGLLVIVAALERAGATAVARGALDAAGTLPAWLARACAGFVTAAIANAANNLPVAVFAGRAFAGLPVHPLAHAVLVGIDLGPNLLPTGSLATLLWLVVLRREGLDVPVGLFFRRGLIATVPALLLALPLAR